MGGLPAGSGESNPGAGPRTWSWAYRQSCPARTAGRSPSGRTGQSRRQAAPARLGQVGCRRRARDDVRGYLLDQLHDEHAVPVVDQRVDQTGAVKKGTHTVGVPRQYTDTASESKTRGSRSTSSTRAAADTRRWTASRTSRAHGRTTRTSAGPPDRTRTPPRPASSPPTPPPVEVPASTASVTCPRPGPRAANAAGRPKSPTSGSSPPRAKPARRMVLRAQQAERLRTQAGRGEAGIGALGSETEAQAHARP